MVNKIPSGTASTPPRNVHRQQKKPISHHYKDKTLTIVKESLSWVGTGFAIFLCIIPCSIYFCVNPPGRRKRYRRNEWPRTDYEAMIIRHPPTLIPKERKRSLSISETSPKDLGILDRISNFRRKPKLQRKSPLFTKLPAELRILIWKEVIGHKVHIFRITGRFIHMPCSGTSTCLVCTAESNVLQDWRCSRYLFARYGHFDIEMEKYKLNMPMGLLKSCRLIYTEAITYFYSHPVFHMHSLYAIDAFPHTLLPKRLHKIRRLHLTWAFPGTVFGSGQDGRSLVLRDPHHWELWGNLGKKIKLMEGLVEVELTLTGAWLTDYNLTPLVPLGFLKELTTWVESVKLRLPIGVDLEDARESLRKQGITGVGVDWVAEPYQNLSAPPEASGSPNILVDDQLVT